MKPETHKAKIRHLITAAFEGVDLGDGIGLWEAQAIDDYQSEEYRKDQRSQDRTEHWQDFSLDELQRCYSSLCFFDATGMRFHLPAFILAELEEPQDHVLFSLTQLDDYKCSMFTTLNQTQRLAIKQFLKWCLSEPSYEFYHPHIEVALEQYWNNSATGLRH